MNNENDENDLDTTNETYVLAILAALLNPELCKTKPDDALSQAGELLRAAMKFQIQDLEIEYKVLERRAQRAESLAKKFAEPVSYSEVVKFITRENKIEKKFPKLYRARERFAEFWAWKNNITGREAKRQLLEYEKDTKNFTREEMFNLREEYDAWKSQPRKSKGKQGRVKNREKDERKQARPAPMPWLRSAFDGVIPDESA
jgi:hypothetical protein